MYFLALMPCREQAEKENEAPPCEGRTEVLYNLLRYGKKRFEFAIRKNIIFLVIS